MLGSRIARVVALSFVLAAGCGSRLVPLTPSSTVLLPQQQQADAVRAAIARAMAARQYVAESEEPGRIVARYARGNMILRLQIAYTPTQYEITYLDSQGFGQMVDQAGQTMISAHYPRQVQGLSQTIDSEIARPAREAAEAAERERQQQLALAQEETNRQQAQLDAQSREAQAQRDAQLESQRLDVQRAEAEANARRPVIVAPGQGTMVGNLAFDANQAQRPGFGVLRGVGGSASGLAGGPNNAAAMSFPNYCPGFFAEQPSHVLNLARDSDVRVQADSRIDTTLAIVTSDGSVWCDDDSGGNQNPRIEGAFPAGVYYVWVGSYNSEEQARYRLSVSRYEAPVAVADPEPVVQQPVRDPQCTQAMINAGYASQVNECLGVETQCALAMIQAGYGGQVGQCRGVESQCAVAMVHAGYGGQVAQCQGVEPRCAVAMVQAGYGGQVAQCQGVDGDCAVQMVRSGNGGQVAQCR